MFEGGDPPEPRLGQRDALHAGVRRTAPRSGPRATSCARDPTLEHPRCVFQVLRRHYARYTPEMVERICGVPARVFLEVADSLIANSGRERTTMLALRRRLDAAHGGRADRSARARSSSCCSATSGARAAGSWPCAATPRSRARRDIPTLYEILPGYLPTPRATEDDQTLADYVERERPQEAAGGRTSTSTSSPCSRPGSATPRPRRTTSASGTCPSSRATTRTSRRCCARSTAASTGCSSWARTPRSARSTAGCSAARSRSMKWLVVRDLADLETAHFWRDSPEIRSGEHKTEEIATEVFLMPCAGHVEKEGHFTNTQRLLQWRDKALDPPGDARSSCTSLPPRQAHQGALRGLGARARLADPQPDLGLPGARARARAERRRRPARDQRLRPDQGRARERLRAAQGGREHGLRLLDLLRLLRRRRQPDAPARRRRSRRAGRLGLARVGLGLAGEPAHPLQPRLRRSGRQAVVGAQAATSGGTRSRRSWTGYDVPDFPPGTGPTTSRRRAPRAWTRSPATPRSS